MGELLTAMVGYDAFTQALTNPLLGPQVFNEATFTRAGLKIIQKTRSLQQILARNVADPARCLLRFTYGPERRGRTWWRRRGCTPDRGYGPLTRPPPMGVARARSGEDEAPYRRNTSQRQRVTAARGADRAAPEAWRGGPCPSRSACLTTTWCRRRSSPRSSTAPPSATAWPSSSPRPSGGSQRLTWCNEGAVPAARLRPRRPPRARRSTQLFPTLGGGELKLLLRRERAARMTLPVRTASGADAGVRRHHHPVARWPDVDDAHRCRPPTSRSARCAPPPTPTSAASPP